MAKDRESKYALVELCDDNQPPSTCHYALYNLDQEESDKTAHAETGDIIQFHLDSQMPVEYVVGSRFNYFVAWHFEVSFSKSEDLTIFTHFWKTIRKVHIFLKPGGVVFLATI